MLASALRPRSRPARVVDEARLQALAVQRGVGGATAPVVVAALAHPGRGVAPGAEG